MNSRPSVVYIAPDKMGGMMNIIAHLIRYGDRERFDRHMVFTHNAAFNVDTRFDGELAATSRTIVEHSLPDENLHAVMRRLADAVPSGPGVVVASDLLDLAMLSAHDTGRAVILILHGDSEYYYDLAERHAPIIHAFVAYSRQMYDTLRKRLPHRAESILHLPYGIPMPSATRRASDGPLRLLFVGRLSHGQKGVFDLPEIDRAIDRAGCSVRWTIIGGGPDESALRAQWSPAHVEYLGPLPHAQALDRLAAHDLFVLPTRYEGFPVALLEAMAAGLVPVVSAIDSGVPEVVENGRTGLTPPTGNVAAFADAIVALDRDRGRLERFSAAAAAEVRERFDIVRRAADYDALYARYAELYRPLPDGALQYGSRLDQPWIPNAVVRMVRTAIRAWR